MKKNVLKVIFGVVIIIVGFLLLGSAFNWWSFNLFFDGWWTLFIFIPCIYSVCTEGFKMHNILGLSIAVLLLLSAQNVINWGDIWKFFLPLLVIAIGVKLIFGKSITFPASVQESFTKYDGHKYTYSAVFGANSSKPTIDYVNGEASAVFGAVELNFREFDAVCDIYLKASAVFGGVEIFVPRNVKVVISSNNFLGGTDDTTDHRDDVSKQYSMYIQADAVFGGVEIKN